MSNIVDIDQVKPDIDEMAVGVVKNPLTEEFKHPYAGRMLTLLAGKEENAYRFVKTQVKDEKTGEMVEKKKKQEYIKVIPSKKQFPLYVAVFLADHLAQKIVRAENREYVNGIKDEKKREIESGKPIADFQRKVWAKMKELVETESNFFDDKDKFGKTNEEKFVS